MGIVLKLISWLAYGMISWCYTRRVLMGIVLKMISWCYTRGVLMGIVLKVGNRFNNGTRCSYQLYLLNNPKLFNKFTMVNADTTWN